jgi:hypothetical protein
MLPESSELSRFRLLSYFVSAAELLDEKSFDSAPPDLFSFSGFCMGRTSVLISLHFIKIPILQAIYNFTFLVHNKI